MKKLTFLDPSGDGVVTWDDSNEEDILVAEKKFNELKEKGYSFRGTEKEGNDTVLIANRIVNKFNDIQDNEEIFALPVTAGG